MKIVADWFGWYWGRKDANLLADIISDGISLRHHQRKPLSKDEKHRFDSVIKRIKEAAKSTIV